MEEVQEQPLAKDLSENTLQPVEARPSSLELTAERQPIQKSTGKKRRWHHFHKIYAVRVFFLFIVFYLVLAVGVWVSQPIYSFLDKLFADLNFIIPIFWPLQTLVNMFLPLAQWDSPMFMLLPIPGFFFMYYLVDWMEDYFKFSEAEKKWFPVIFWIVALLAYAVVLLWYFANLYTLSLDSNPQWRELGVTYSHYLFGGKLADGSTFNGINFNYWNHLKNSPYLVFCLSAFFGWVSRKFVIEIVENKPARGKQEKKEW